MLILLAELILPLAVSLVVFIAVVTYRKIQYPQPIVFGCIIPKVCAILYQQVVDYNEEGEARDLARTLRRESRWQQFRVNWGYLSQQALNTSLFLAALRFEKMKISPSKPGLEYEPREVLILELLEEASQLRWQQVRWQLALLWRMRFGLSIDKAVFVILVKQYKQLEEDIIALTGMEENCYRDMLVERLGLTKWGLVNGGNPEPESA